MIVRIWRGYAEPERAGDYERHVTTQVFPSLASMSGHRGAYLLQRRISGRVEFLAVTLWDSLDAIKKFAGDDPEVAVVEPVARAALAEFDDFVRHYDLTHAVPCSTGGEPASRL